MYTSNLLLFLPSLWSNGITFAIKMDTAKNSGEQWMHYKTRNYTQIESNNFRPYILIENIMSKNHPKSSWMIC